MTDSAAAYWVVGRGAAELRRETLPEPAAGQVRVRTRASAISRGTEALVFHGRVPESEWTRMRCPFQAGDFPWPVKYGYAAVGVVEAGEASLRGRRVFCLHPHQDRFVVPASAVSPIPDQVPDSRAALAANLETALNGLWDSGLADDGSKPRVRVAVVGAGTVGFMLAILARELAGAEVQIVDPDPARAALARALGFIVATPDAAREADIVFEVSGVAQGLVSALGIAAFEGIVVALSWFGDQPVTLPLGGAFHAKRLTIRSSQVGAVSPARRAVMTHAQRLARAIDLLADPVFDKLIGEQVRFAELPAQAARLFGAPITPPATIVTYPD